MVKFMAKVIHFNIFARNSIHSLYYFAQQKHLCNEICTGADTYGLIPCIFYSIPSR